MGIWKFLREFCEATAGQYKTTTGREFFDGIKKIPRGKLTKQDNIINLMFIKNKELMEQCDFDRMVLKKLRESENGVYYKKVDSPYFDTSNTHNGFRSKYAGKFFPIYIGEESANKISRNDGLERIKLTSKDYINSTRKYLVQIQTSIGAPKEVMKKIEALMVECIEQFELDQIEAQKTGTSLIDNLQ